MLVMIQDHVTLGLELELQQRLALFECSSGTWNKLCGHSLLPSLQVVTAQTLCTFLS